MVEQINEKLEYKERIRAMSPEERSIEVANLVYDLNEKLNDYVGSGFSKKGSILSATTISAIIIGLCEGLKSVFGR